MLSDKARRVLFGVAREYGVEKDLLYQRIFHEFGIEGIKGMTDREAYYIVDCIKGKDTKKPSVSGMATAGQLKLITEYVSLLGWQENPKRLRGFLIKYAGVDDVAWLNTSKASKVIESLKRLYRRENQ